MAGFTPITDQDTIDALNGAPNQNVATKGFVPITDPVVLDQLGGNAPQASGAQKPSLSLGKQILAGGLKTLPAIGATLGGIAGGLSTLPTVGGVPIGMVAGGALGGGMGASLQKAGEQYFELAPSESTSEQLKGIAAETLMGGLSPGGGQAGKVIAPKILSKNFLTPAMQQANELALEKGMAPAISMLRPDSKVASVYDAIIGKIIPFGEALQRRQMGKIIQGTGDLALSTQNELIGTSVKAARAEQGKVYQQAIQMLPERVSMPKTVEYAQSLLSQPNIKPDTAAALTAFVKSVDEVGTVSREMLGTFKSNLEKAKVDKAAQKELNRLMQAEMPSEEAAKLWGQADEAYAYLSKLGRVEKLFKTSFTKSKGYKEFNPANFIDKYDQMIADGDIPKDFKPLMDKVRTLAGLSTESTKRKAELSGVMMVMGNALGISGLAGMGTKLGATPAIAMGLSALALANSSTARRGIIRRLATSGYMSKEAAEVLGDIAGRYGTMQVGD